MRRMIVVLLGTLALCLAHAEETPWVDPTNKPRLPGLCGMRFGTEIRQSIRSVGTSTSGYPLYPFVPRPPFMGFTQYCFMCTPRSRLVFGVHLSKYFRAYDEVALFLGNLREVLEQHYRLQAEDIGAFQGEFFIGFQDGQIEARCMLSLSGPPDTAWVVILQATNMIFAEIATEERKEIELGIFGTEALK